VYCSLIQQQLSIPSSSVSLLQLRRCCRYSVVVVFV